MRLFAAVFPPPDAVRLLHVLVDALRPKLPELTWVAPELWHVTLAFFGDVPADEVSGTRDAVAAAVAHAPAMSLRLHGGGAFPDARDPRVIWAGVAGDVEALAALAAAVAADARSYHPHLTLARMRRRAADVTPLLSSLEVLRGNPFVADEVVLMHSEPGLGGSPRHYTPLDAWPLRGQG